MHPRMKFSLEPSTLHKALRAMQRRHPLNPRRDSRLRIMATADGVTLETNLTGAFLPAHVAVAGGCEVSRESVTRVAGTFPRGKPVTVEARDGWLRVGGWSIETSAQFTSRENERYSNDNQGETC
ncbi:MAG: hypothetical protein OJF61_000320 [Rhodanobacteraceae bacterium]|jgi:hypothetical protein|nr:MAG: hypothetical protein OJF61_000320 [Rhodanobacteraceae bacterium]